MKIVVFCVCSVLYSWLIINYSITYNLDWINVAAQVKAESNFDAKATSHVEARGLMQIMDSTGDWLVGISGVELYDPNVNLRIGTYYMRYLINYWSKLGTEDYRFSLASYNAGPGRVKRIWKENNKGSYDSICLKLPKETQNYVDKIIKFSKQWRQVWEVEVNEF